MKKTVDNITKWINEQCMKAKKDTLVVGVSGGVDSAVTSTLCALTGRNVIVINIPIYQNKNQINLSSEHMNWLKKNHSLIETLEIDMSKTFDVFSNSIPNKYKSDLSLANTRARLRMATLYQVSASSNGLVVGTGNKIEDFGIGFFTKYGDGGVDISPIGDLMKSEVYKIGEYLKISNGILIAEPTDGLWSDGRTDEDQIGVSYDELEWAMRYKKGDSLTSNKRQILNIYNKHRKNNLHKMKNIPVYKIK